MPDISSSDSEPGLGDIGGGCGVGFAMPVSMQTSSSNAIYSRSAGTGETGRSVGTGGGSSLFLSGRGILGRSLVVS